MNGIHVLTYYKHGNSLNNHFYLWLEEVDCLVALGFPPIHLHASVDSLLESFNDPVPEDVGHHHRDQLYQIDTSKEQTVLKTKKAENCY